MTVLEASAAIDYLLGEGAAAEAAKDRALAKAATEHTSIEVALLA